DTISVIDAGGIIAEGTADELKTKVGGDVLDLRVADRASTARAALALARAFEVSEGELTIDRDLGSVVVPVAAVRALDAADVEVADLGLRRPSLDDVFLSLTGHVAEEQRSEPAPPRKRRPMGS